MLHQHVCTHMYGVHTRYLARMSSICYILDGLVMFLGRIQEQPPKTIIFNGDGQ